MALKTNAPTLGAFASSSKSFENNACRQATKQSLSLAAGLRFAKLEKVSAVFPLLGLWRPLKHNSLHKTLPLLGLVRERFIASGE